MSSRSILAVLVAGAVTLSGLAVATSASAAPGRAPVVAPAPDPETDFETDFETAPLARAADALGGEGRLAGRGAEATLALRDLFLARPTLDEGGRRLARGLLARPTDGARDPFADGYRVPATRTCADHVCVHRVRTTSDRAEPAWARTTLRVMEDVWAHHVGRLGYRRPATDRRRGGNARFDVYLKELGSRGVYGYCAPERRVPGQPKQASGFCVLDNDFARSQYGRKPLRTLQVTAAHEFFHAVQFAYDFGEDQWLLEQTATWMEEQYADDVNDNRTYLRYGQLARPGVSLDLFEPAGFAQYGNWVFWEYLAEGFGRPVVRRVIQRAGTGDGLPDEFSAQALRRVLKREGGLSAVFTRYAGANARPRRSYAEGRYFPSAPVQVRRLTAAEPLRRFDASLDHLSSRTLRLRPDDSLKGRGWRLRLTVDAPPASTAPGAYLVLKRADGTVRRRLVPLDRDGNGSARVAFSTRWARSVTITLANASTRSACGLDTSLACKGEARDQQLPFALHASLSRA